MKNKNYDQRYRMKYIVSFLGISFLLSATHLLLAQEVLTDANTPLHLLKPDYPHPYGEANQKQIEQKLDLVLSYLESVTPAKLVDKKTNEHLATNRLKAPMAFAKGQFRLTSYEWGVTYAAMLDTYEKTTLNRYHSYAQERLFLLRDLFNYYQKQPRTSWTDSPIHSLLEPHALDDAGAICMAMIKYSLQANDLSFRPVIDHLIDFILHKEHRLADGTFARNRPQKNTVWLDDLFMSVPAIAYMGKLTGDKAYYDEACKQVLQFAERMFDRNKKIFIHGWLTEMDMQPQYHWGRANGWAIMAMTELLDVLPKDHKDRPAVMAYYKAHVSGIAALQSGTGFWHQLLDRNDSYLETSATAIFTYCLAKGMNNGWLDYKAFGPMTLLAWDALASQVNPSGQIMGTCVGTGMGFDPAFYYYRPVNVFAAHSYGPFLLAGAEVIGLLKQHAYRIDETAVQFNP
ncbi:glycoside hydrolase family 88/105 protein [Sphingobacterium sp. LRF_L2]|uniref:glycoside hydrolase family 88/105 protein n=1 Tax=Sphingobacterium sp. LRF_L2 TaxID=3369421 RepID=UPI003F5E1145